MARVKKVSIRNIMGIQELDIEPGAVTVIEGGNAAGKTSALEAIKSVISGGHDVTLIRRGADSGEVVYLFDDDVELRKRITPTGSQLTGKHPTMGRISAAQTYLRGLTDHLSVNPVEFLTASDRVEKLLEAMPLTVPKEALVEAVAGTGLDVPDFGRMHALEAIEAVRKRVYDERTGVNRVAKEQRTTAEQLAASLPDGFTSATVLENQLKDAEGAHRDADRELQRRTAAVDAEREREIAALKENRDTDVRVLQEQIRRIEREAQQTIDLAVMRFDGQKDALLMERRPQVNQLSTRVTQLREQLKAADRDENTRRMMDAGRAKAEEHEGRSLGLTDALGRLELLKIDLLASLPIPGVEIVDGEIHRDGIPFPRMNHAAQVRLAVDVARLRAGDVPLVCVDGLECLEADVFRLFVDELASSGLQAIVTRVSEGPLRVTSIGAVEEVAHA